MWSEKSFPCSAGLLLCFLQVIVVLLQHTCAATNKQNCASSCGKITNISHPFRLKDDPEICGDRRYELVCENNVTVLSLFSGKYYVQAINYRNYTIQLVDPAIQEGDCSSIPRQLLFASNFTDPYRYLISDDDMDPFQARRDGNLMFHHVIYMNCSNPVRDDPVYVATAPCVNWHSPGHVYAVAGNLTVENLKGDCRVKLVSPTSIFSFYRYGDDYDYLEKFNQNFTYAEIHRMLAFGFQVSWMRHACEDLCSSSYCILGEITETLQCFDKCYSPLGFYISCENLPKLRIYVEGLSRSKREHEFIIVVVDHGKPSSFIQINIRGRMSCKKEGMIGPSMEPWV